MLAETIQVIKLVYNAILNAPILKSGGRKDERSGTNVTSIAPKRGAKMLAFNGSELKEKKAGPHSKTGPALRILIELRVMGFAYIIFCCLLIIRSIEMCGMDGPMRGLCRKRLFAADLELYENCICIYFSYLDLLLCAPCRLVFIGGEIGAWRGAPKLNQKKKYDCLI